MNRDKEREREKKMQDERNKIDRTSYLFVFVKERKKNERRIRL